MKIEFDIRPAPFPIRQFLEWTGFEAITMPWQTIYALQLPLSDELIRHEAIHILQIREMGAIRFTLTYLWYLFRYGYWNNPLEVDARTRSATLFSQI